MTERERMEARLKDFICTLKKASKDTSNGQFMCESQLPVMNFDKMSEIYKQERRGPTCPKTNDALYITKNGEWYFIEFKNGRVKTADIHDKIYDSVIMLVDLKIIPDFEFARQNFHYILVYNDEKNQGLSKSQSRDEFRDYMERRAQEEIRYWDVDLFERYLYKSTHTYTKEKFYDLFVLPMEQAEQKDRTV